MTARKADWLLRSLGKAAISQEAIEAFYQNEATSIDDILDQSVMADPDDATWLDPTQAAKPKSPAVLSTEPTKVQRPKLKKTWVVTSGRPRDTHGAMDGETVPIDQAFSNGMMYPGEGGDPKEVANCACTVAIDGEVRSSTSGAKLGQYQATDNVGIVDDMFDYKSPIVPKNPADDLLAQGLKGKGSVDHKLNTVANRQAAKEQISADLAARLSIDPRWQAYIKKNPLQSRGVRHTTADKAEDVVSNLISGWAETSGDTDRAAIMMQVLAKEEFKLAGSVLDHIPADVLKAVKASIKKEAVEAAGKRAFLRAMYDQTQAQLAAAGIDHVTVYRGLAVDANLKAGSSIQASMQPMSSTSTHFQTARNFAIDSEAGFNGAPIIVAMKVPRSAILSSSRTGFGCLSEHEYVTLGVKGAVRVIASGGGGGY